jgi:hypothetical protein
MLLSFGISHHNVLMPTLPLSNCSSRQYSTIGAVHSSAASRQPGPFVLSRPEVGNLERMHHRISNKDKKKHVAQGNSEQYVEEWLKLN